MSVTRYRPRIELADDVARRFRYHPPKDDQRERYELIRDEALGLATILIQNCPESRELAMALTHLDQVVMCANAAIARHE